MVKLAPLETTVVEPVGIAYLQNSLFFEQNVKENNNANGDNNDSATNDADAIEDEEVEFELEEWEETRRPTEGKNKGKTIRYKKFNYYKALGLKNEWRSTDAQIKKNYQKGILKFHPDKIGGDEKDPMFLKIQEAYQNLIDPQKKKDYDSHYEFDDTVPKAVWKNEKHFFKHFTAAFKRNARFSVTLPVPELGDMNATKEEVDAFYEFWGKFESWRNFKALDEHIVDESESRDDRRWMEKQNTGKRAKRKRDEYRRLRQLYENARKIDPRIAAFEKAEKDAKAAAVKKKKEEEERAKAEEEAKLKADAEAAAAAEQTRKNSVKNAREARQKQKKQLKKARKKFMKIYLEFLSAKHEKATLSLDDVQYVCDELSLEELLDINARFTEAGTDDGNVVNVLVYCTETCDRLKEEKTLSEAERIKKRDEARQLAIEADKKRKLAAQKPWTKDEMAFLIKATKKFPGGATRRWEQIADMVNKLSKSGIIRAASECIKKANSLSSLERGNDVAAANAKAEATSSNNNNAKAAIWNDAQQKQLEAGLRKFPQGKLSKNQRWEKISAGVDGKSPNDCLARFDELVALHKKGKK